MLKPDAAKGKGPKGGKHGKTTGSAKSIKNQVDLLREQGNQCFKNSEVAKAIQLYNEGLQLDPKNVPLNCNLSLAYLTVGEYMEAEVHAVVALAHQKDLVKGFYRAAKAAASMDKNDRALHYLQKGRFMCPNAEDLKVLYKEICHKMEGTVADNDMSSEKEKSDMVESASSSDAPEKKTDKDIQNKMRSRSVEGSSMEKTTGDPRSTSVSRMMKEGDKPKKSSKNSTIAQGGKQDHFMEMLTQVKDNLPENQKSLQLREREALRATKERLLSMMKMGSEALKNGLARQASEKYKNALELMAEGNIEVFGMSDIDQIVLKYSLSISWIDTLNYGNIVQSIGYLTDLEINHAAKLPAVYYGLGRAFYRLNRTKIASEHLGKGLSVIQKGLRITAHPWPGTMLTIQETTKEGLKESLHKLIRNCKIYQVPDAICRYESCLTVSTHISPSELIFYSDPDYVGYVVIICQERCRITFHIGCWKDYKEKQSTGKKITEKDILGQPCLTSDCIMENNEPSVIIRIEIFGDDGNLKSHYTRDPTKTDYTKKDKKKKNGKMEKPPKEKVRVPRRQRRETSESLNVKKGNTKGQDFKNCLKVLDEYRKENWPQKCIWDPRKDNFGQESVSSLKSSWIQDKSDSLSLRERKDFLFTYFYEYMKSEGPQKISIIEQKWKNEVSRFPGVDEFMSPENGICDFLLQSVRFASVDDYLCLSHQLSSVYRDAQAELAESTLFILNTNSALQSIPRPDDLTDPRAETNGLKINNSNNPRNPLVQQNDTMDIYRNDSEDELDYEIDGYTDDGEEVSNFDDDDGGVSNYDYDEDDDDDAFLGTETPSSDGHDINYSSHDMSPVDFNGEAIPSTSRLVPGGLNYEIEPSAIKQFISSGNIDSGYLSSDKHSDNPVTKQKILVDEYIQTEGTDYQKEYEVLKAEYDMLKREKDSLLKLMGNLTKEVVAKTEYDMLKKEKDSLLKLTGNLTKEVAAAADFRKLQESKVELLVKSHEKVLHNAQLEISKRDGKIESMTKKHQAQMEKLQKKLEEEVTKAQNDAEMFDSYSEKFESLVTSNKRVEEQLKKSLEENLNSRRFFGDYMLDAYIAKCKEKLECLEPILTFLQGSSSSAFFTLKTNLTQSYKEWKDVQIQLNDAKSLLKVQYEILSEQKNKSKVSAESLLQLEFPDLPREPANFQLYLQEFILSGLQQIETSPKDAKTVGSAAFLTVNSSNAIPGHPVPSNALSNAASLQLPYVQGQDLYMAQQVQGFQQSYYYNQYFPSSPNRGGSWPANGALNIGLVPGARCPTTPSVSPTIPPIDKNFPLLKAASTERLINPIAPPQKALGSVEKGLNVTNNVLHHKSTESLPNGDLAAKGAVAKKKDKVSGLTPIEFTSKPGSSQEAKLVTTSKTSSARWNYQKLLEELQKHFRDKSEVELSECLVFVREKNGNKLSGLSVTTIIRRVEKVLEEKSSKKAGSMGMDKFGGTAWGEVKNNDVNWHKEEIEDECIICHVSMDHDKTTLQCRHTFHTQCIRKWLHIHSTCPVCRKYTRLVDEFPPLTK